MQPAASATRCGRDLRPPFARNPAENREKPRQNRVSSNGILLTTPAPPPPVARPGKGASLAECLGALEIALSERGPGFIVCTVLWRRLMPLADDRAIAREQAALVHRLRRVLGRRGQHASVVFSVLERSDRQGLHAHFMASVPCLDDHPGVLDAVEAGLVKKFGELPRRSFNRDGWRRGSINTDRAARGALAYRLKSLPRQPLEHGVHRGVGLRPVECVSVKVSRGRNNARD